jgi:ATP-dependent Lon protease
VEEIEKEYIKGLSFHYVDRMEEVVELAIGLKKATKPSENGAAKRGKKVEA